MHNHPIRRIHWSSLLCILLMLARHPSLAAQAPERLEPRLFLVDAHDDFLGTPIPSLDDIIGGGERPGRPGLLARFHDFQKLQADKLVLYLSHQKERDNLLLERYEHYRTFLREVKKVVEDIDKSKRTIFGPYLAANMNIKFQQIAGVNNATQSGLYYALSALGEGSSPIDALLSGYGNMGARLIEAKIKVQAARQRAQQEYQRAVKQLNHELRRLLPEAHDRLLEEQKKVKGIDDEAVQALADKFGWGDKLDRTGKDWNTETDRPHNPFLIERIVRARIVPEGLEGANLCLKNAEDFLFAAQLLPKDTEFAFYKARLLAFAGLAANKSCALQVGSAGFGSINRKKKRLPGAALAQKTWRTYAKLFGEPADDRELSHQMLLAYAYGNKDDVLEAGRRVAKVQVSMAPVPVRVGWMMRLAPSPYQPANPNFWFDAACLSGCTGNVKYAFEYLQTAVRLGFARKEEALSHPDLESLRVSNSARFQAILDSN